MKYQHLKKQNESFIKQIEEQEEKIKNQTIFIDKLINEKINLLSKLEIQRIKNTITPISSDKRVNPFKEKIITVSTPGFRVRDLPYFYDKFILDSRIINNRMERREIESLIMEKQKEIEKAFIVGQNNNEGVFTITGLDSVRDHTEFEIIYCDDIEDNIKTEKPKDWYQKHNTKKKDFMLYDLKK